MLTLLVGAALVVAWALRLGFIANFISEPVLVGFKAGIAIVIVAVTLTIIGTFFRGPGWSLVWPWDVRPPA